MRRKILRKNRSRLLAFALIAVGVMGCEEQPEVQVEPAEESPLIALTPTEFNNAVRDLLGMPANVKQWPSAPKLGVAAPIGAGGGIFGIAAPAPPVWPYTFPAEAGVGGFEGIAAGQVPSSYQTEQLQKAARHYGAFALVSPVFFTCEGFDKLDGQARDDCAVSSLLRFTSRAWRRPLSEGEAARISALWQTMAALGEPKQAIALAVSAVLQSPGFLFRVEQGDATRKVGDAVPLTDWEMASRLSFALWDSMPDGELFAAAANGQLRTKAQIEAQARRMLQDPKALATVQHFHHQWLGTDQLHRISPSRRIYGALFGIKPVPPLDTSGDGEWPALMNPLRHSYKLETDLFVRDALFGRPGRDTQTVPGGAAVGTFTALMTMRDGYVSSFTAPVYGVGTCDSVNFPGGSSGGKGAGCTIDDKKVDLDPSKEFTGQGSGVAAVPTVFSVTIHPAKFDETQRAGILTLPSVLALGAHAVHPSPILRGKRLLERVACVEFAPPPAAAEAAAPPDTPDPTSTNRERTEASTKPLECTGCHETLGLNMAGFAFEHYDSFGHWRAKDGDKDVDASGLLPLSGQEPIAFTDGVDLSKKLASNERVRHCYVGNWTRYIIGDEVDEKHPELRRLKDRFITDDNVIELLVSITTSDLFRYRHAEVK